MGALLSDRHYNLSDKKGKPRPNPIRLRSEFSCRAPDASRQFDPAYLTCYKCPFCAGRPGLVSCFPCPLFRVVPSANSDAAKLQHSFSFAVEAWSEFRNRCPARLGVLTVVLIVAP